MSGMPSSVAVRNGASPVQQQPGAALELRGGQTMWTKDQHAALVAMGIPKEASSAELGVFLHQCQRTGLDPFSKQIYLIYRPAYENNRPVMKPTTQVGIDGFRVIRDRIARRDGLRVEYADTLWYSPDGQGHDVWLWDEPPAACKFTVLVDGRRFPATLRFGEYVQRKKGGEVNKMWSEKAAHMIEKCAEADALRRAFPHDMAGVILEDAAPLAEDLPAPERQRGTAADARARAPQTVTASVVTPDASPAGTDAPTSEPPVTPPAETAPAGEAPVLAPDRQVTRLRMLLDNLGYTGDRDGRLRATEKLANLDRGSLTTSRSLTREECALAIRRAVNVADAASLATLLDELGADPRDETPGQAGE